VADVIASGGTAVKKALAPLSVTQLRTLITVEAMTRARVLVDEAGGSAPRAMDRLYRERARRTQTGDPDDR
jgi:hypothetical protein